MRALAYKWQRIIWKCWQTRTVYQEERYEAALQKSGSPLVALLGQSVLTEVWTERDGEWSVIHLHFHQIDRS